MGQITERGYLATEPAQRLGVNRHSLCVWKRQLTLLVSDDASMNIEIRQLKREPARVTEERHILTKAPCS